MTNPTSAFVADRMTPTGDPRDYQVEKTDEAAYDTLSDADLGVGAVINLGYCSLHIVSDRYSPNDLDAEVYRVDASNDRQQPQDRVIIRHDLDSVQIEYREYDRDSEEILTNVAAVDGPAVITEDADKGAADEDLPESQSAPEVDG